MIITVEKRKNVCWKLYVDLKTLYTNVYPPQLVIDRELTYVQQKVSLNKDFMATNNLLETDIMQPKHHYQNIFEK